MEKTVYIERTEQISSLFGNLDINKKMLEEKYHIKITSHSGMLKLEGATDSVSKAYRAIICLLKMIDRDESITTQNINYVISMVDDDEDEQIQKITDADCIK